MEPEWIQAISSAIQAFSIIFIIWQVKLLRKQISAEHELARRTRAIDDLRIYSQSLNPIHTSARKLAENFSTSQCADLISRKPFYIPQQHTQLLGYIFTEKSNSFTTNNRGIRLSESDLAYILQIISEHLNNIEVALQGWYNGIADEKIIMAQLKYIISKEKGHYILERFRNHELSKNNYPAIAAFVAQLKKEEWSQTLPIRGHTG